MLEKATTLATGSLAYERGLMHPIAHKVPPPAKEATFRWVVYPAGGVFQGRVYSNGSRLDGPTSLLARNGWAFVVLDDDNVLIASASGIPPGWVDDIPGTEVWVWLKLPCMRSPGAPSSSTASLA